jgi:type IV pilus assembly protein PilO
VDAQFQEALKLLPNEKEIPALLTKLSELGNESQLDVRLVKPKSESSKEFYVEMPVAIEVRGTYNDVAVFFDRVGHMERIMNIQNVSMKPEKERSTTLITTCDATTYRFKGN